MPENQAKRIGNEGQNHTNFGLIINLDGNRSFTIQPVVFSPCGFPHKNGTCEVNSFILTVDVVTLE